MSENLGMPIVKLTQGQEAEMTQWQAYKTLRDEFAAQAFGPILAFKIAQFGHPCDRVYDDASRDAYEAADRAIQARKETDNPESETVGFQSAGDQFAWYTVAEIAKIAFREGYEAALDDLR